MQDNVGLSLQGMKKGVLRRREAHSRWSDKRVKSRQSGICLQVEDISVFL